MNLNWADLTLTTLTGAYLLGVRLKDANLGGACFKDAKLVSACLSGSDCHQTNFQGAVLSGAGTCGTLGFWKRTLKLLIYLGV